MTRSIHKVSDILHSYHYTINMQFKMLLNLYEVFTTTVALNQLRTGLALISTIIPDDCCCISVTIWSRFVNTTGEYGFFMW